MKRRALAKTKRSKWSSTSSSSNIWIFTKQHNKKEKDKTCSDIWQKNIKATDTAVSIALTVLYHHPTFDTIRRNSVGG